MATDNPNSTDDETPESDETPQGDETSTGGTPPKSPTPVTPPTGGANGGNYYNDAKGKYGEYKQAESITVGIGQARVSRNLEKMVSIVDTVFPPFHEKCDLNDDQDSLSTNVEEAKARKDIGKLTDVATLAHQYNTSELTEEFMSYFTNSEKFSGVLRNSPQELLVGIVNTFYNPEYDGSDEEFFNKHKELVYRTESLMILQDPEAKLKYNTELTRDGVIGDIEEEYEAGRESYEDQRLDETVKNMDRLFGKPQTLYVEETRDLSGEVYGDLPNHPEYLSELGTPEQFINTYAGYWEKEEAPQPPAGAE